MRMRFGRAMHRASPAPLSLARSTLPSLLTIARACDARSPCLPFSRTRVCALRSPPEATSPPARRGRFGMSSLLAHDCLVARHSPAPTLYDGESDVSLNATGPTMKWWTACSSGNIFRRAFCTTTRFAAPFPALLDPLALQDNQTDLYAPPHVHLNDQVCRNRHDLRKARGFRY